MPEDVLNEPTTHTTATKLAAEEYDPTLPSDTVAALEKLKKGATKETWQEIQRRLQEHIQTIREDFPDLSEEEIQSLAELVAGPFMLEQKALRNEPNERLDLSQKCLSARIQHNMVHAIFYASSGKADAEYVRDVYTMVEPIDQLAKTDAGYAAGLPSFMIGVKSELAIIRQLNSSGYTVLIPDYNQGNPNLSDPVSSNTNEVLQWDVLNGIDFIAKQGDQVYFVDAKGRLMVNTGTKNEQRQIASVEGQARRQTLPPTLEGYELALRARKIEQLKVFIPTAPSQLPGLAPCEPNDVDGMQRALTKFGKSSVGDQIIEGIDQLTRHKGNAMLKRA